MSTTEPAACPDCGHQHTPNGCTGDPTPSDLWAGVSVEGCDCIWDQAADVRLCRTCAHALTDQEREDHGDQCEPCVTPPASERDPLECPPDGGCGGCGNWPEHCACVTPPG